jgi:2OG-Fe(II) oxygenase superfamily
VLNFGRMTMTTTERHGAGGDSEECVSRLWSRWASECLASEEVVETEVVRLAGGAGVGKALVLRKLVPRAVCAAICAEMDAERTAVTTSGAEGFRAAVRESEIWAADAAPLMEALWARCGGVVREELGDVVLGPELRGFAVPSSSHGRWSASGLNPRVGVFRYGAGGHFAPHYDGTYRPTGDAECESQFTLVVYLGAECEGGATLLLADDAKVERAEPRIFADGGLLRRVSPEVGGALIFQQRVVLHAGELVSAGRKVIMRSDVLFRRVARPDRTPRQERCLELIRLAQEKEAAREYEAALEAYQAAERLDRDLFRAELH